MKKTVFKGCMTILLTLGLANPAWSADIFELEKRIDSLSEELDHMKGSGGGGHGGGHERVSVHGYGEMHINASSDSATQIDAHRLVIGVHAELADWIHLNAEVDFEHAAQELELELAYLDFLLTDKVNARAGVMLVPVGSLNEFHEPPLYWTVERPEFQSKIIPTSWSAGGFGFFGTPMEGFNYRLYVVNSLQSIRKVGAPDGSGIGNGGAEGRFRASSGIRSGRLQINRRIANDWAITGRAEFSKLYPGLQVGFSFFNGDTTQGVIKEGGNTTILEADMKYRNGWFDMNAAIANIDIDDAAALNAFCATAGGNCTAEIADNIFGWNIQAGVHLFQLMGRSTTQDLVPFVMYEKIRPQDSTPSGTDPTSSANFDAVTVGLSYMPVHSVALKADFTTQYFEQTVGTTSLFNLGIAYMY